MMGSHEYKNYKGYEMSYDTINILPDGKLESQWEELKGDITFELHDIKINSTFNLDEDEGLKEYQGISGKLTTPFESLHVKDESKSENDKTIVLKKLDINNVDIYIGTSSEYPDSRSFNFIEYSDSIRITAIIPISIMESVLKQIHTSDMTISLSVNFENSFYDRYAPEIYDVYLTNTKGEVSSINVSSKSIEAYIRKQDAFKKKIVNNFKKIGNSAEDIKENTVKFWEVRKLADELSQQEWDNTKVTQILLSVCIVLLGIILYKIW